MPKAHINIDIDADINELATLFLERMGLDQTTAIDMFFRQIIAERRLPFQPIVNPSLDEQVVAAIFRRNPKKVKLEVDETGNVIVDKELYPDIHDWAENG